MAFTPVTRGVFPIAPTPFLPNGQLDYGSVGSLMDFYLAAQVQGVTVLGFLGEPAKLDAREAETLVKAFAARKEHLELIVGVSAPGFAAMRALAHTAMEAGAAAVMLAPPPSLRTDEQILAYFDNAAEALGPDVPFILQDYPLMLSVVFTPKVIRFLVNAHASCAAFKHEDWPGLEKISALKRFMAEGSMREVPILTGNGGMFLDFEMGRGANGVMTGYAFPEMLCDAVRLAGEGKKDALHTLVDAHLPYMRYEQQPGLGLAVRKYTLALRGALAHETQRPPMTRLSETGRAEAAFLLERLVRTTGLRLRVL